MTSVVHKSLPPRLVAITGGSCSGKSTLAMALLKALGESTCTVMKQDNYYHDMRQLKRDGQALPNFDSPDAVDYALLRLHLKKLRAGQPVPVPLYHFPTHSRSDQSIWTEPKPIVIVEGMLVLADQATRDMFDFSYFIECDESIRLSRRLERDVRERGRTPESVMEQFETYVRPSHSEFVEPMRHVVDVVITQKIYMDERQSLISRLKRQWS